MYGSNCDIQCPINCKDNMCHIQFGKCFTCKPGWTGKSCIISMKYNKSMLEVIKNINAKYVKNLVSKFQNAFKWISIYGYRTILKYVQNNDL